MRNKLKIFYDVFVVAAICIIAAAAWNIYGILSNYAESNREYEDIRKHTGEAMRRDEDVPFDECWGYTPGKPLIVDFEALKEINPDIIGWIYIPGLEISYPVLKCSSNDQYLHTTYKGTYAYAGSIFIDELNKPDFYDKHTIIYGHNMNNGSMFGRLREFVDLADPPFNPYVWIMTEDMNFCYRIFSSHIAEETDDSYLLFDKDNTDGFSEWEEKIKDWSTVDFEDIDFAKSDRVITLSTCHADHVHRRVVHALMIHSELPPDADSGSTASIPEMTSD